MTFISPVRAVGGLTKSAFVHLEPWESYSMYIRQVHTSPARDLLMH